MIELGAKELKGIVISGTRKIHPIPVVLVGREYWQRVFDMDELNNLTIDGQPGETVAVDVLRGGQPMQLYLPRGPIGITGGGRFRGRP